MTKYLLLAVIGLVSAGPFFDAAESREETDVQLSSMVPVEMHGWRGDGADKLCDSQTIFDYMDGAGEVYLSFHYRGLFVRTFEKEGRQPIIAELFDMGRADDAFGVFTRSREGDDVGIGQGSEYRSGYLVFWKGRYFASVYALEETEESKEAVFAVGRSIAAAIEEEGDSPALVVVLPEEGRVDKSVRFFHKYTCLNQQYFVADDNILNLGLDTDAALAEYRPEGGSVFLLVIEYPTEDDAAAARQSFIEFYIPEGGETGAAILENGKWTGLRAEGRRLVLAFDASSREQLDGFLLSAAKALKGNDNE